ncbi:MAG: DegT/DnrJ/EryC1/StrS family aminotransferase [Euryarchaeota archaeon]|nr:DegT/DnrJ/EryC1/StrS family aminotransferase [Euryarchaeota archaeon]
MDGKEKVDAINIAKPMLGPEEKNAVLEVMSSGKLAQGEKVDRFEKAFAAYVGTRHAVAVGNGTIAIHLALLAHGVGRGMEVVTTPFTFIGSVTPILFCQARPVFADIVEKTYNIDPADMKKAMTRQTKAIIPVHLFGLAADMDPIMEAAGDVPVIEDACQAHGAVYKGRNVGSIGSCACYSFYPTKNMTTGEGGMITTNNEELAAKLRLLRDHGQKTRYEHVVIGYNYRMNDISAAIGIEQLRKLESFNGRRIANAKVLSDGMSGVKQVKTPVVPEGYRHVFHQYSIRAKKRDGLKDFLNLENIRCGIYYPRLVTANAPIKPFATRPTPRAERATREVLALPVHPGLSQEDLARMVNTVAAFYVEK